MKLKTRKHFMSHLSADDTNIFYTDKSLTDIVRETMWK